MAPHIVTGSVSTERAEGFLSAFRNVRFAAFIALAGLALNFKKVLGQEVTASPICGSDIYDLETLKAAPYWTITQPGICYLGTERDDCTFNLAFCKDLPKDKTRGLTGIGASQELTGIVGTKPTILGQTSRIVNDGDGSQLFVTYADGDLLDCGHISVVMRLMCNKYAVWEVPDTGAPGIIPFTPLVVFVKDNENETCLYEINADYAGACGVINQNLSLGTVLIIIFFCVVTVYLIGGVIYNKIAGATGKELIPNYETWNRLPSDIMVGCGFFFSCITCQGRGGVSHDAYDKI